MNDSITSLALRQARRIWPLLLVVCLVGGLAAGALANRRSKLSANQTLTVAEVTPVSGLLGIGALPNVDVRQIAFQIAAEYELTDFSNVVAVSLTPDTVASTIMVEGAGHHQDEVLEALASVSANLAERATQPRLVEIDQSIASHAVVLQQLESEVAELETTLQSFDDNDSGRDVVLISLVSTRSQLLAAETRAQGLDEYRSFLTDSLVRLGPVDIEDAPGITPVTIVTGVLVTMVLAAGALFAWVVFDRRTRRGVHLMRAAPDCEVIGVLPRRVDADSSRAELFAAALHRSSIGKAEQVLVIAASDTASERQVTQLFANGQVGDASISAGSGELPSPDRFVPERTAIVLAARFGQTHEDRVAAVATELQAAGYSRISTCLTHVPARDLDWASWRPNIADSQPTDGF